MINIRTRGGQVLRSYCHAPINPSFCSRSWKFVKFMLYKGVGVANVEEFWMDGILTLLLRRLLFRVVLYCAGNEKFGLNY